MSRMILRICATTTNATAYASNNPAATDCNVNNVINYSPGTEYNNTTNTANMTTDNPTFQLNSIKHAIFTVKRYHN